MAGRRIGLYFSILKMWTIATSVKPPAARPTPHITSKAIQSPHGNLSLRLVEPPNPYMTRNQVAYNPHARMTGKTPPPYRDLGKLDAHRPSFLATSARRLVIQ